MYNQVLNKVLKNHWYEILVFVKRSDGLSIKELEEKMKMSYMGIKQHCMQMKTCGLLRSYSRPVGNGRPEIAYYVSQEANSIFFQYSNELLDSLLETISLMVNKYMPEKLISNYIKKLADIYKKQLKNVSIKDNIITLTNLKENDGYISDYIFINDKKFTMIDYHSPFENFSDTYETIKRSEEKLITTPLETSKINTKTIFEKYSKKTIYEVTL